jgi:MFS family permease
MADDAPPRSEERERMLTAGRGQSARDDDAKKACQDSGAVERSGSDDKSASGNGDKGQAGKDKAQGWRLPRPFEKSYATSLAVAILALVPFIIVSTAYTFYRRQVAADIGAELTSLAIVSGISVAGYAFGAMLGGDLVQRWPQRPLFLAVEVLFVLGSLLAAVAGGIVAYGAGRVLQGFATGIMLVAALPPVIRRFPADRLPITAAVINLGFFGAVMAGPLVGGAVAYGHAWRWFYGGLGAIGALVLATALFTLPDQEPQNPDIRFDAAGVALALGATVLPFWAAGELTSHGFGSYLFTVPLAIGLAAFAALLIVEYHKDEPLSPVKEMWHTFPLIGTWVAMAGGGVLVTFLALAAEYLMRVENYSPLQAALLFWPEVPGALIGAALLGLLLRTRFLPVLVLAGMLALIGGGVLLLDLVSHTRATGMLAAAGLLGLGGGTTVSPGLYLAGFSLPSKQVGRTFALVELVRSVADYLLAPVMLRVVLVAAGGAAATMHGIAQAIWVTLLIAAAATGAGILLYLAGGAGLPKPDIKEWIESDKPAIGSPLLAEALRTD